jgi:hypothetical protein
VHKPRSLYFWVALVVVIILYFLYAYWVWGHKQESDQTIAALGTFGDAFGALNTLFSGLVFVGAGFAVWLQRTELEAAYEQNKKQDEQLRDDKKHQEKLAFEATFFQLLNAQNQIVSSVEYNGSHQYKAFSTIKEDLTPKFKETESRILTYEHSFQHYYRDGLGHYFKHLYRILKFVDKSAMIDKNFYTGILRAQLSASQLFLLFYNGLSCYGKEKFKPLIEEYKLFEQMPVGLINDPFGIQKTDILQYDKSAFGDAKEFIDLYE